jgi:hypothetical protein
VKSGSHGRLRFASAALVREAALPLAQLDRQICREHEAAIDDIFRLEAELNPLTERLTEILHAAIPKLDRDKRRKSLALRRAIFACEPPLDRAVARQLADQCNAPEQDFQRWLELAEQRKRLLDVSRTGFVQAQNSSIDELICAALAHEQFRHALRLTSPGVYQRISHLQGGEKKARQIRKKLLRFTVRAATSTAPLNGLATVSLVLDGTRNCGGDVSVIRPSQEVLRRIASARPCIQQHYRLNRTVAWADGICTFTGSREPAPASFRRYETRRLRLPPPVESTLKGMPVDEATPGELLIATLGSAGMPEEDMPRLVDLLVASGLLITGATDGLECDNAELADQLAAAALHELGGIVRRTPDNHAPSPPPAPQPCSRTDSEPALGDWIVLTEALEKAQAPAGRKLNTAYATFWQSSPLPHAFLQRLYEGPLRDFLQHLPDRYVQVHPIYCRLLRDFLRRFGHGGTCLNLFDWLRKVDFGSPDEATGGNPPPRMLTAPLGATVYFDARTAAESGVEVHCENIYCHVGWQLGRFAFGNHESVRALRMAIKSDVTAFVAPAKPVTLSADADLANIQANPALFEPVIVTPGQMLPRRAAITSDKIVVKHDVETNRLLLYDGEQEIRPIYNGGLVPRPHFGVSFLTAVLAEPFQISGLSPPLEAPQRREVRRVPPHYIEGVIVAAGSWWIPAEALAPAIASTGFDRFIDLRRLWKTFGIEHRSWACGYRSDNDARFTFGRPQMSPPTWIDIRSDACIDALAALAAYDWIVLFDALSPEALGWADRGRVTSVCTEIYFDQVSSVLRA